MCEDKTDWAKCAIETVGELLKSGEFKYSPLVEYDFKNEVIRYYEEHVEKDGKKDEENDGEGNQNNEIRKELYDEKVGLKKYILYKKMNKKWKLYFDCDNSNGSCPLTGNIYKVLWGKGKSRKSYNKYGNFDSIIGWESTEEQPMLFGGDVMNSFATTLEKTIEGQNILGLLNEPNEDDTYSINDKIKKEIRKENSMDDKLNSFAHYTHTIGNFCLVPAYYNRPRNYSFKDYWDAGLARLKYLGFTGTVPTDKHKGERKSKFECNMFNKYINTFFLWDYVVGSKIDREYEVKSLIQKPIEFINIEKAEVMRKNIDIEKEMGKIKTKLDKKVEIMIKKIESFEENLVSVKIEIDNCANNKRYKLSGKIDKLIKIINEQESEKLSEELEEIMIELDELKAEAEELNNKEEIEHIDDIRSFITTEDIPNFLTNAEYCIKRRSIFMVAMLDIATNHEYIYEKIQDQVFLTNDVYSGYNQVFYKITSIIRKDEVEKISGILSDAKKQIEGVEKSFDYK